MNDLPQRKRLRLTKYDYSQDGMYFVTICTEDKKCILSDIIVGGDAHIAPHIELSLYGKVTEKYIKTITGIKTYVIMPNHIHMIIEIDGTMGASSPTISSLIRSFKTLTTKEIGFSIFQRSFYDHIIRDEDDYITKAQYIENNPAKWSEDKYYNPCFTEN